MRTELETVINLVKIGGEFFVSTIDLSDKLGFNHDKLVTYLDNLDIDNQFKISNMIKTPTNYLLSADGFFISIPGFTHGQMLEFTRPYLLAMLNANKTLL